MPDRSLDQVIREALRQYERQTRPLIAKQNRPERNKHVSAQVTKMTTEREREWSKLGSLNDLTRSVCSVLNGSYKSDFLQFAVEGLERTPSSPSTYSSEISEDSN